MRPARPPEGAHSRLAGQGQGPKGAPVIDAPAIPDVPGYPVPGEAAPAPLVLLLLAMGLLMTIGAVWLAREVLAPAGPRAAAEAPAAPAPVAASQVAAAVAEPVTPIVALPACPDAVSIFFPTARATPEGPEAASELAEVMDWARKHPGARLLVEGHADAVGADETNVLLSFTRAKTVAAMLVAGGLTAQQLQVTAAGSQGQASGLPGGAREHRRVTVQIHDPDGCKNPTR